MQLAVPRDISPIYPTFDDIYARFELFKSEGIEFAFFVTDDYTKNMHGIYFIDLYGNIEFMFLDIMKWLECEFEICTQDLMDRTLDAIVNQGKMLTLVCFDEIFLPSIIYPIKKLYTQYFRKT